MFDFRMKFSRSSGCQCGACSVRKVNEIMSDIKLTREMVKVVKGSALKG